VICFGFTHDCAVAWLHSANDCAVAWLHSADDCAVAWLHSADDCAVAWLHSADDCAVAWLTQLMTVQSRGCRLLQKSIREMNKMTLGKITDRQCVTLDDTAALNTDGGGVCDWNQLQEENVTSPLLLPD